MVTSSVFYTTQQASESPYNYVPTEWICIFFVVSYSISTAIHMGQAFKYKLWWMIPTATFAGVLEIFGWSARLWSSRSPQLLTPFEMQLVGTIIAPTPLVAANFIILGKIITQLGPQFSRLTPNMYTVVFCSFDVICLTIQAVGGAFAAQAVNQGQSPTFGGHIMLGGIAAQLFSIVIYVALAAEFLLRRKYNAPFRHQDIRFGKGQRSISKKMQRTISGLSFCTLCIFIRSVYRTVELADGWSGLVISTEVYFNWLDGAFVTVAIYTLNIMHPGICLRLDTITHASQQAEDEADQDYYYRHRLPLRRG
ncbi:RTA1 like protein-domain-containing protein [Suillus clintonianus]|uniref:RTA1 like protein-domain-containing protein n=1 Tax=Suillus clintonianus TaxID=1904413 RepID=UPI001B8853DB|nr:RTA1 like protein-domain-containing protein [Suillus clintonianus]KAG2124049.1 RTA1 like protein-domain-containing protein [Suillus clintonianus]